MQRAEGGAAEGRTSAPPVARPAGPPASDLRPCARTPPPTLCPDLSLRARPKLWLPVPPSASPVSVQLPTGCGHVGTGSGLGLGTSRPNVGATGSRLRTTGGQLQDRISGAPRAAAPAREPRARGPCTPRSRGGAPPRPWDGGLSLRPRSTDDKQVRGGERRLKATPSVSAARPAITNVPCVRSLCRASGRVLGAAHGCAAASGKRPQP